MDILFSSIFSPPVLFFGFGVLAALVKADIKLPPAFTDLLSVYLLIAIGLKGGVELADHSIHQLAGPITVALFLGSFIPVIILLYCYWIGLNLANSVALAVTYGSVSIVTYGTAIQFLTYRGESYESFMSALVVLMESPAILISLFIYNWIRSDRRHSLPKWSVMKEVFLGKSVFLLLGSLLIGLFMDKNAVSMVKPLFMDLYSSVLVLFLLSMGLTVGAQLKDLIKHKLKLFLLATGFPLINGLLGVFLGNLCGLSMGGSMLMGVLAASASYIAAPAALKIAVPGASPAIYLGFSLGVTFPFNVIFSIPLLYQLAEWIVK